MGRFEKDKNQPILPWVNEFYKKVFPGVERCSAVTSVELIPFVVEVAYVPDEDLGGPKFHFGLNFAPASSDPLQGYRLLHETKREDFEGPGIKGLANRYKVYATDKIHIVCHLTYPRLRFKDRGKTILEVGNE